MKKINQHKQHGVGLIEVLITVLILSTSLMAIAALQTRSLQYNHSAFVRSKVNIIAYDIIDRIRIKSPPQRLGNPEVPSNADIVTLLKSLPGATGEAVCVNATRICTVKIKWTESTAKADDNTTAETAEFIYTSRV